jgi:hypothetical protein
MRAADAIKADCARVMERAKKATPRPWRWWTSCSHVRLSSDASGGDGDVLRGDMAFHDRQATVICGLDDREHITEACNTAPTIAQDALDLLGEVERLRARLAECGPGIERLRDLQQAYAGGGDYMRQLLEALEVKLPTKEPS